MSRPSRCLPWALPHGLLLLGLVLTGLLAMHGVRAATGPTDLGGVPLLTASHGHPPDGHMVISHGHAASAHGHPAYASGTSGHAPYRMPGGHRHPGGQMCLALLVISALLVLASAPLRRWARRPAPRGAAAPVHTCRGRPPPTPSVYRLCVLRR